MHLLILFSSFRWSVWCHWSSRTSTQRQRGLHLLWRGSPNHWALCHQNAENCQTGKDGNKTHCWLNSLWPSDAIWWQGSRSKLVQVMACCLTAPSHYLNQCWLIITDVHLRVISHKISQPSVTKISLKIVFLRFYWNLPGANELMQNCVFPLYRQCWRGITQEN